MNLATQLIAAVFGPLMLLMGLMLLFQPQKVQKLSEKIVKSSELMFVLAMLNLMLGLFLVNIHNIWDGTYYEIVVTVLAWITLLKGLYLMFIEEKRVKELVKMYKKHSFMFLTTLLALLLGGYLTYVAYFLV